MCLSVLARQKLLIIGNSTCDDVVTCKQALLALNFVINEKQNSFELIPPSRYPEHLKISINGSATAARFFLAICTSLEGTKTQISICQQLAKRPHSILIDALRQLGADIQTKNNLWLINGKKLKAAKIILPAHISSQYSSALCLIAPCIDGYFHLEFIGNIVSQTYLDMTIKLMEDFGVAWKDNYLLPETACFKPPLSYTAELDTSAACYFLAWACLHKRAISIPWPHHTYQADAGFVDVLRQMGAEISYHDNVLKLCGMPLRGAEFDMHNMPDQVPTLAILALFARGTTRIYNVAHLRHKESDRLQTVYVELAKLGADIQLINDEIVINGQKKLTTAPLKTYGDHRLVMAFSILASYIGGVVLDSRANVNKSFPNFFEVLDSLA